MGTAISVDVRDERVEADALGDVFAWFRRVDDVFSTYKINSQMSRLARGDIDLEACDADVAWVLRQCEAVRTETSGFFDAWASGALDPSGFVKGWSVDVASDMLAERGSANHCINAGGDIRLRGEPEPGRPWNIGIAHPLNRPAITVIVEGRDCAVATSGIAERGLHVLDPHTREPVSALASVTLVGPALALTDAYATAALAMGLAAPAWLAARNGYEAWVIDAGGFLWHTPGFPVAAA